MRISNQILDAYDDIYKDELVKIAKAAPDLYMRSPEELQGLQDHEFGLTVITKEARKLNKFPLQTPDDVWLSNAYFHKTAHRLPNEAAERAAYHIKKACLKNKIKPTQKVASMAKESSTNIYYELEGGVRPTSPTTKVAHMTEMAEAEKIASNYTFAQYAFKTPNHVQMGAKYFEKFASEMPLEIRHGYAEALQQRATELGMENLRGGVGKYASDRYSSMVGSHVRGRASLLDGKDPQLTAILNKLASSKNKFPPSDFAKALHSFDKHAGLTKYYGSHLSDPYQATFAGEPDRSVTIKTASGGSLDQDQLKKLATVKYAKIKEYFGNSVASEFKKDPTSIFESLPMDAKEILVGIADGTV